MQNPLFKRRPLFWDVAENTIPDILLNNDEWVVVRVFEYGTMDDIFDLINLYGEGRVKEILMSAELPRVAETIAFILFDIPKKRSI